MDILRIGDKVIDKHKIYETLEKAMELRIRGMSQQETANELGLERSFISRLEGIGELRKGGSIAVVGFPIKNIPEIKSLLTERGVEYIVLFTEKERWDYIRQKSGIELFNDIMGILQHLRTFNKVIILGSKQRVKMIAALLDNDVITFELGESPLSEDVYVDPKELDKILNIC